MEEDLMRVLTSAGINALYVLMGLGFGMWFEKEVLAPRRSAGLAKKLLGLVESWERSARRKHYDAARETSDFGRKFILHGAICYCNCAWALKAALGVDAPPPSPTPEECQTQPQQPPRPQA